MKAEELIKAPDEPAPPEYACEWDNPGLLVGDSGNEINSVYLTLDVTTPGRELCQMLLSRAAGFHNYLRYSDYKGVCLCLIRYR